MIQRKSNNISNTNINNSKNGSKGALWRSLIAQEKPRDGRNVKLQVLLCHPF